MVAQKTQANETTRRDEAIAYLLEQAQMYDAAGLGDYMRTVLAAAELLMEARAEDEDASEGE